MVLASANQRSTKNGNACSIIFMIHSLRSNIMSQSCRICEMTHQRNKKEGNYYVIPFQKRYNMYGC